VKRTHFTDLAAQLDKWKPDPCKYTNANMWKKTPGAKYKPKENLTTKRVQG